VSPSTSTVRLTPLMLIVVGIAAVSGDCPAAAGTRLAGPPLDCGGVGTRDKEARLPNTSDTIVQGGHMRRSAGWP
jgi:hypothetical protein